MYFKSLFNFFEMFLLVTALIGAILNETVFSDKFNLEDNEKNF